ncbi:hypothetical protein [Paremcibacter congregatus]|mgnify:CR=1 FL=1|uniref:phage fiber-tail adaptor protein n=1 Tax=Paremcibacter congregatus TaxID=2043170 RepID=UPI0030ED0DF5|tara:strand:- start:6546 stop:6824 length:279 start_codon:yes stop_codon:yes gene_type:complete
MSDFYAHDPDAGPLDYSIDFTDWLTAGDSVASVAWAIYPLGPTLSGQSLAAAVATVKISGGTLGGQYRVTASVTTANGLVDDRSIIIRCGHL